MSPTLPMMTCAEPVSAQIDPERLRVAARNQSENIQLRLRAIEPCLEFDEGSAEHSAAVAMAAKFARVAPRSIYRWRARYRQYGVAGLGNREPVNARQARVVVSREFDRAFLGTSQDIALLAEIGRQVDQRAKDVWASAAQRSGVTDVRRRVEFELKLIAERHGLELPTQAFRVSRRRVERFSEFRQVDVWQNDKGAFSDGQPHITRDWTLLPPMGSITADVKYVDVVVQRDDGTRAYPKLVCLRDDAIGRVFVYPILLPSRRKGVRREHVIEAFLAMVRDPLWGFPETIYIDNGTEFSCLPQLGDAFSQMASQAKRAGNPVIKAKPYHASAKTVEGSHAALDRYLFSILPGYVGSDRMKKKTQNQGHEPEAFSGSWSEFCEVVGELVHAFNGRPPADPKALSPNERLQARIEQGWRPMQVDPAVVDAAFCRREGTRRIDRGGVSIDGQRHHHPMLDTQPNRKVVSLIRPWQEGALPMVELPDGAITHVKPDLPYHPHDNEGAREARRRQQRYVTGVRRRKAQTKPYEPIGATVAMAKRRPALEAPGWGRSLTGATELDAVVAAQERIKRDAAAAPTWTDIAKRKEANQTRVIEKDADLGRFFHA